MSQICMRMMAKACALFSVGLLLACTQQNPLENPPSDPPTLIVDGQIALASLVALSDGHIRRIADGLRILADSDAAQTSDWPGLKRPLTRLEKSSVPATRWFALSDGTYWTTAEEESTRPPAPREIITRAMEGETVIAELAVRPPSHENIAVVAIPIVPPDKEVLGVLGASLRLDELSTRLHEYMDLDEHMIFYAFDRAARMALAWDPGLIMSGSDRIVPEIRDSMAEMMSQRKGIVQYTFRNRVRTVVYQRSSYTDWWYAFGVVQVQ